MKTDLSPRAQVALYGLLCILAIPFVARLAKAEAAADRASANGRA